MENCTMREVTDEWEFCGDSLLLTLNSTTSQKVNKSGHSPYKIIQLVFVTSARPRQTPAAKAAVQLGFLSHLQNRYVAPKPKAVAGTSGVMSSACPRRNGSQLQNQTEINPAKLLPHKSRDHRKQKIAPVRLNGMNAQRAIVNSQMDLAPFALMKSAPMRNSGRASGES